MLRWSQKIVAAVVLMLLLVAFSVVAITVVQLKRAAINESLERLHAIAHSWRVSIEAIAQPKANPSLFGSPEAQRDFVEKYISDAYGELARIGSTGEIRIGIRDGQDIRYVFEGRPNKNKRGESSEWNSTAAEPMRRALSGESGTLIGLDYRGVEVLAAHEPVPSLFFGIVVKIDKAEVEAPFYDAMLNGALWLLAVVVVAASYMGLRIYPILREVDRQKTDLREANSEIKTQLGVLDDAQQKLKQYAAFLETLFDTIPFPIFFKDQTGIFRQCNYHFATNVLGRPQKEVLGYTAFDFEKVIPKEVASMLHHKDRELMDSRAAQQFEVGLQSLDGQTRQFIFHQACVTDSAQDVKGLVGIMLEVGQAEPKD